MESTNDAIQFKPSMRTQFVGYLSWVIIVAASVLAVYGAFQVHYGIGIVMVAYVVNRLNATLLQYEGILLRRDYVRHQQQGAAQISEGGVGGVGGGFAENLKRELNRRMGR